MLLLVRSTCHWGSNANWHRVWIQVGLTKEKKESMPPSIVGFPVTRGTSSLRSIGQHEVHANGSSRLRGKLSQSCKVVRRSSAGLWLSWQPCWKTSCLNLCSELPWPTQVSHPMTSHCRDTCVRSHSIQRLGNRVFSPVLLPVPETHKVGAVTIPPNFDTTSLTHGGQQASPGNNSPTQKSWTALWSHPSLSHSLSLFSSSSASGRHDLASNRDT